MRFLVRPNQNLLQMCRCMCGFWSGMNRVLAAAAPLLGVTGLPESNLGQIFRGPGVVVMVLDACVARRRCRVAPNICGLRF